MRIHLHKRCDECDAEARENTALRAVAEAARVRLRSWHNDTCGAVISTPGAYPCSCGHDGLGEALEALDAQKGEARVPHSGTAARPMSDPTDQVAADCLAALRRVLERHGVQMNDAALDRLRHEIEWELEVRLR